jgi:hypothetical protein
MNVLMPDAQLLRDGVWETRAEVDDLALLGQALHHGGPVSVVAVAGNVTYDAAALTIQFEHRVAAVLNLGNSDSTIVLEQAVSSDGGERRSSTRTSGIGDDRFLATLPDELSGIGRTLLEGVRAESPGSLTYKEKSGKFVETPDNFWTVKIQPRDGSLRITLRGVPERHTATGSLQLVPDMGTYSSFKLSRAEDVEIATRTILAARRM